MVSGSAVICNIRIQLFIGHFKDCSRSLWQMNQNQFWNLAFMLSPEHDIRVAFWWCLFTDFFDCKCTSRIIVAIWECSFDFFHEIEEFTMWALTCCHEDLRFIIAFEIRSKLVEFFIILELFIIAIVFKDEVLIDLSFVICSDRLKFRLTSLLVFLLTFLAFLCLNLLEFFSTLA